MKKPKGNKKVKKVSDPLPRQMYPGLPDGCIEVLSDGFNYRKW